MKPTDGHILALEVTEQATGEWIYDVLRSVTQRVGVPVQIISDRASNIHKGIQLFQTQHPSVISTYDVTHAMANLLKNQLLADEIFQNFLTDCHYCRQLVQQTELAFAAPPAQRSQCRYFNLERLVNWASQILKSDLSLFCQLVPKLTLEQLVSRLEDKFGWLKNYIKPIRVWKHLLFMTRTLEKQIKNFGLNWTLFYRYCYLLSCRKIPQSLQPFQEQILNYLEEQIFQAPGRTLLATSDVLESIFGRYKYFSGRCPVKELRSLLLTIPLSTINFTNQFVKKALMSVHSADVNEWISQVFGQSNLSKRKILFGH